MKQKSKWTNMIIFAAILVFLNLVSISIFTRLDISQGKVYSLSSSSKDIVKHLDDRVLVKAYFSKNLPSQYADLRRYVEDMLDEYAAYGKGNFKFEFIDPTNEDELKQEAQQNMIQPATMRVNENDQLVIREVFMGLAFHYHDKTESIPIVQNSQGLEYDITSKIKKITEASMLKVGFFALDDTEPDPRYPRPGKYDTIKLLIGESYEMVSTQLEEELNNISVLVFAGISEDLTDIQLQNLDKFIVQGGKVLFFQDRVEANLQNQTAKILDINLFNLLQHYGIIVKENLVADAKCGQISIQRRQGIFNMNTPVNYPYLPLISNLNEDHPITKNIDLVQNIFASELDTLQTTLKFQSLFTSSDNSGVTAAPNMNIRIDQYLQKDLRMMLLEGRKTLGGIYSGEVKSMYPANNLKSKDTEIIFVADSDFILNGGGASAEGNMNFFINSIDYLSGQKALISIRSRETIYRELKEVTNSQKDMIKYFNVVLPTLLLILMGIFIHRKEVKRRKQIGEVYEQ